MFILIKILGYVWLIIALIVILFGLAGIWMKQGFTGVQEIFSPFSFLNWFLILIIIAPGVGLLILSNKLHDRIKIAKSDSR